MVKERKCSNCSNFKAPAEFPKKGAQCKVCKRKKAHEYWEKLKTDPVKREARNRKQRENYERCVADPVKYAELKRKKRESNKKCLADPVKREEYNRKQRENYERCMADPVKRAEYNRQQREIKKKRMADPVKREAHNRKKRAYEQARRTLKTLTIISRVVNNTETLLTSEGFNEMVQEELVKAMNKKCNGCGCVKPITKFPKRGAQCKVCKRKKAQERHEKIKADPVKREARNRKQRENYERRMADPVKREAHNRQRREWYRKNKAVKYCIELTVDGKKEEYYGEEKRQAM